MQTTKCPKIVAFAYVARVMGLVQNIERRYIALSIIVLRTCVHLELCCIRSGSSSIALEEPGAYEKYVIALNVILGIKTMFTLP
ncbi:hypothetical protein M0804_006027 [Polistes exclamans]|nr:hypothetical protein M0804_006027 [Polistes exclamans]